MSKIGEKIIEIHQGVNIILDKDNVTVKGSQGEIVIGIPNKLEFIKKENGLSVKRSNEEKKTKSIHGLYRQLINNAVLGVQKLWEKRLKIVGTGYTVKLDKDDLVFKIGYSHPVIFKKVPGIKFQVEGNNKAVVLGSDKQLVGQVAYQIKILKK